MNSLRRWLYRPKRSDPSLLAQFYFADEELNLIAAELDSFEGRKDPERCTALVNQLRACQARVLNVVSQMMDESVKEQRAPRDFRVKFPDDVIQENLAGQLWFGAECLAAGSSIMNREVESACMRPLARALTKNLDSLRTILREQCLRNVHEYTEQIRESLIIFDKLFAEFELSYVTAMVPVKTAHEYDMIQEITVLFSETVHRALKLGLLTRDMIDEYDPALMFTIPRLAIVSGVLIFKDGPLNPDNDPWNISEMFRPFQTLLLKIRELLGILTDEELNTLERALCSQEEPSFLISLEEDKKSWREERRKSREEKRQKGAGVKAKKKKDESDDGSIESELTAVEIAERLEALALSFEASRNAKQEQTSEQVDPETPSKSSESSSSSSSLLSEGESEEADGPNIVKGEVSDHLDDAQVQRFTNQLYYEANLDSHGLRQDVTLLGPLNAFTPGEIFTTPHSPLDADSSEPGDPTSGAAATPSDSHAQTSGCDADANFENSAAGRTHFAMNKCDSSDSGLHSEVLSNSGSMFTISSSDSNQILGMSDALVRSDSSPDRHSPSPPHHSCVQCDGDCKDDVTANCGSKDVTLLDSRNSSSTLAPESESSCDDDKCLTSPPKESDVASAVTISDEDDIMVSPLEENRRLIDAAETVTPHQTHCDKEATPKEAATSSPVSPNSEDLIAEKNAHTSPSDIQELNCLVSKGNVELEQEDQGQQGDQISGSRGRVSENEIQHIESDLQNHSFAVNGDSESLSKKNIPLEDCQGDLCKPEDACDSSLQNDNMVNGSLPTEAEVSETSASGLPQSNVIATLSFPDHAPISLPLAVEDGGNSDVISECSLVKEELEKDISESAPTDKEPPLTTLSNSRVSDTEPSLTVCSPPHSSPPATTTSQVTTSSPTAAAASNTPCPPVSSSTNEAVQMQTTMPASMSSSSPSSSNERQNHSPSTHPPSRSLTAPSASAPATNHVDTKGPSSKSKGSSRKSSKATETKGRRRGDPTCSSQRTSMPSQAKALMDSQLLDDCYHSSETSSYTSECGDQEEIALAIKAAESATRHQVRARFRSSSDMIHRLFVCISGVADQLQTNFAGDLRNILRAVFDINCSEPIDISEGDKVKDTTPLGAAYRAMSQASRSARRARHSSHQRQDPPLWIPDEQSNECMSCQVPFTFVRRRHHCRNCGKIFCSRCSSNFVPLPHFGQEKAVRVCNRCFMFRVTPFTVRPSS